MDEIAHYNQNRWKALTEANAVFTRPWRDLTPEDARQRLDPDGAFGDLSGKKVLCLACGGGQQSVAFALLGAAVTVTDLSAEQLQLDREMAAQYGVDLAVIQADMRDLSMLEDSSFDLVYHPYAINFVPDCGVVFEQVRRVLQPGGWYHLMCANPFAAGVRDRDWNGDGYPVYLPYEQGQRIAYIDEDWVYDREQHDEILSPVEYRQTLGTLVSKLAGNGFVIVNLKEVGSEEPDASAEPGTWEHFTAVLPPWIIIRSRYRPEILG